MTPDIKHFGPCGRKFGVQTFSHLRVETFEVPRTNSGPDEVSNHVPRVDHLGSPVGIDTDV
jgi:hypothetical protein